MLLMQELVQNQPPGINISTELNENGLYNDPVAVVKEYFKNPKSSITPEQHARIQTDALAAHTGITVLENRVSAIDTDLQNAIRAQNDIEQYIKGWNILIHGLTDLPVRESGVRIDEFEFQFIDYICGFLNRHLGEHLHQRIQPHDIERAHTLYQGPKKTEKRVVVVRFVRRVIRNNIFFNRRYLKNTKVSISDHLSAHNRQLLDVTKAVCGRDNTWTSLGQVFSKLNDRRYEFTSLSQVKYVEDHPEMYGLPCHNVGIAVTNSPAEKDAIGGQEAVVQIDPADGSKNVAATRNAMASYSSKAKYMNNPGPGPKSNPRKHARYIKEDLRYNNPVKNN